MLKKGMFVVVCIVLSMYAVESRSVAQIESAEHTESTDETVTYPYVSCSANGSVETDGDIICIKYTVNNNRTANGQFSETLPMVTEGRAFFYIMEEAASKDATYQFNSTCFEGLGEFIDSINGLWADNSKQLFWAFLLKTGYDQYCTLPVGVSLFVPDDGDHVVFSYEDYGIFNRVPECKM